MINVCIVGYGAIGPVHAEAIESLSNTKIYGICDIDKTRANDAAKKHNALAFYNYDECIADENIDYIHICTPHYLHFDMITKALKAGKRVVVEKPAVMKKKQLDILFNEYDVSKIFPIVQNRTNNCVTVLKELADSNKYGTLKGIKAIVTWSRDAEYYNSANWRGTKEYEGGGVLINQAIHALDLMIYLAGKPKSVDAIMHNFSLKDTIEVEDTVNAFIEFKSGAKGVFFATNAYSKNSAVQLELDFENAIVSYNEGKLFVNETHICSDSAEYNGKSYWGSGHTKTLADLYGNNSHLCLTDVKETMYTMFDIYKSAADK